MTITQTPLSEVCELIRGITFSGADARSVSFADSIPCVTTSAVQETVAWDTRRFVPTSRVQNEQQILRTGDILISTANSKELVGKSCLVSDPPYRCSFGAFVTVARPNRSVYPPYLAYWMNSKQFLTRCFQRSTETTNISNIRISELEEFPFPACDLSEQILVAKTLENADRTRRMCRYALQTCDELVRAFFLEMFGTSAHNWPTVSIEELAAQKPNVIRTGPFGSQLLHSEFTDAGIAVLGIDNAVNNRFDWAQRRYITRQKFEQLKRYTVFPGDVIITIMGTCGRCAIVPDDIPLAINTKHLCCITLNQARALPSFVHAAFLYHPRIHRQLSAAGKGAIMEGLNMTIIKELSLPLPPLPLQERFAMFVAEHERLRAVHVEGLRQADHLFQTLLQQSFTQG